jgi:uncharacterized protein (TIGR04206 family)
VIARDRPTARALGALAVGVLPWTVVLRRGELDAVFLFGLFNTNPPHLVDVYSYLFVFTTGPANLPDRLLAWPVSTALFCLALASLALGVLGREDRRVTAGLFALAGIAHLQVTFGLLRLGETAVPVGALLSFVLAWWALAGVEGRILGR